MYSKHDRKQAAGESFPEYVAVLKKLSQKCEFGTNLEERLRDQIVYGIRDAALRKRFLTEGSTLMFPKAVEIGTAYEAAVKDAEEMESATSGTVQNVSRKKVQGRTSCPAKPVPVRKKEDRTERKEGVTCFCCGKKGHVASQCFHNKLTCSICGKKGHLKSVCKKSESNKLNKISSNYVNFAQPIKKRLSVNGVAIDFEIDTGSNISLISESLYLQKFASIRLERSKCCFQSYVGSPIRPEGHIHVAVAHDGKSIPIRLYVIRNGGVPLLGRADLQKLGWRIEVIGKVNSVEDVTSKFPEVFSDKLGKCKDVKLTLHLREGSTPKYCQARPVPYAIKEKIEKEIDRLVEEGILSPVESSEWATPIVPVLKKDNTVRLCGSYDVTLNKCLEIDRFPIPKIKDVFASLKGGAFFTKIDLSSAYQQFELTEESKKLTTINCHKGLFQYNRLPFGIASSPGLFQREMDRIVRGLDGVVNFLDDILVGGTSWADHVDKLTAVLRRLQENGLTVKKEKCKFFMDRVDFLGHTIDKEGLHMSRDKVKAILEYPEPKNLTELQAFLGLVNYYSSFIPELASILSPLYKLLGKSVRWRWSDSCTQAMATVKTLLASDRVLCNYSEAYPLVLATDASPYGLGAVISHIYPDGSERPIAFASRTLSKAERNYSQIDKEATGIIFGIKKFHQYLWGRRFTLLTDHKPLCTIFGNKRGFPPMMATRLQRYTLFLSEYDYEIKYKKSTEHGNADGLSRVPISDNVSEEDEYSYLNFVTGEMSCITSEEIERETSKDKVLKQVVSFLKSGIWPQNIAEEVKPYANRKDELFTEQGCLLWGHRVVIPQKLRKAILLELHSSHFGMVKMKSVARSYFWWPELDKSIEDVARNCEYCERSAPPKTSLQNWTFPSSPGVRLHADFLGPLEGFMFLVILDGHSKWVEVTKMTKITAERTIDIFRKYFSRWGLPVKVVTDNGPTFTSEEFRKFLGNNQVELVCTPPYHPASNGAAENSVKVFKQKILSMVRTGVSLDVAVDRYLLDYNSTEHLTTGCSPAELQLGRRLRTAFDNILPSREKRVREAQEKQSKNFKGKCRESFEVNDMVRVRDYRGGKKKWILARVVKKLGSVVYLVEPYPNVYWKRHLDQILKTNKETANGDSINVPTKEKPEVVPRRSQRLREK
ncbi:UNVERIFIED_CONTAM: hypothetical protein PYX00_010487 [Menopon gallinae]|uniref:RNA-directed DNA polymerase n=1 Tax=Menopon gallinae TaxID=328185 RepID=A0AAW2HFJ4_9NEOP